MAHLLQRLQANQQPKSRKESPFQSKTLMDKVLTQQKIVYFSIKLDKLITSKGSNIEKLLEKWSEQKKDDIEKKRTSQSDSEENDRHYQSKQTRQTILIFRLVQIKGGEINEITKSICIGEIKVIEAQKCGLKDEQRNMIEVGLEMREELDYVLKIKNQGDKIESNLKIQMSVKTFDTFEKQQILLGSVVIPIQKLIKSFYQTKNTSYILAQSLTSLQQPTQQQITTISMKIFSQTNRLKLQKLISKHQNSINIKHFKYLFYQNDRQQITKIIKEKHQVQKRSQKISQDDKQKNPKNQRVTPKNDFQSLPGENQTNKLSVSSRFKQYLKRSVESKLTYQNPRKSIIQNQVRKILSQKTNKIGDKNDIIIEQEIRESEGNSKLMRGSEISDSFASIPCNDSSFRSIPQSNDSSFRSMSFSENSFYSIQNTSIVIDKKSNEQTQKQNANETPPIIDHKNKANQNDCFKTILFVILMGIFLFLLLDDMITHSKPRQSTVSTIQEDF